MLYFARIIYLDVIVVAVLLGSKPLGQKHQKVIAILPYVVASQFALTTQRHHNAFHASAVNLIFDGCQYEKFGFGESLAVVLTFLKPAVMIQVMAIGEVRRRPQPSPSNVGSQIPPLLFGQCVAVEPICVAVVIVAGYQFVGFGDHLTGFRNLLSARYRLTFYRPVKLPAKILT